MALGQGVLKGKKTYIAAGVTAITAIAGYFTGDFSLMELITVLGNTLGLAFLRGGVKSDIEKLPWLEEEEKK